MDEHISISSDGGGEMGVEGGSEAIMMELSNVVICTTEVSGFIHASRSHNPDQLIKELILCSDDCVETISQISRCFVFELIPEFIHDFLQSEQVIHLGRSMPS